MPREQGKQETLIGVVVRSQTFWVAVSLLVLCILMSSFTKSFASGQNIYNITRNAAFIGLLALGQTAVIIGGGIDLSVGSVMGLTAVVTALLLESGSSLGVALVAGVAVAILCGLFNGVLIGYLRLSPFVVTLGMLSLARSIAMVSSENRTLWELGDAAEPLLSIGGGDVGPFAGPVVVLLLLMIIFGTAFRYTVWGRHLYALGGNREAARLCGINTARMDLTVYVLCSLMAGVAGILSLGWLGSVNNTLGSGYELTAIAAAVIGGAALSGGEGGVLGALVGALLIEVIRNSLLLAGVEPSWQGSFVGLCIIFAVMIERVQHLRLRRRT